MHGMVARDGLDDRVDIALEVTALLFAQRFEPNDATAMRWQGYAVLGNYGDYRLPAGGQSAGSWWERRRR